MIKSFLLWWTEQMRALIPRRFTGGAEGGKGLILAVRTPPGSAAPVVELLSQGRKEKTLGVFAWPEGGEAALRATLARQGRASDSLTLRLPDGVLLDRRVVLPLLAERAPGQVLEYEMDRLTPFAAQDLVWTWEVEGRDASRGELNLRLSFLPRLALRALLEALDTAGARPARLEARVGEKKRWIALRPVSPGATRRWRLTLAMTGGLCTMLAVTAIVLPFILQSRERAAVEARFTALSPGVARAEAARRTLAARAAGTDLFSAEQARVGDAMKVLATLTEILPDNTFLTDLTLQQRKLTMTGQSAAAARLITALSGNSVIWNPVFSAPVTRVGNGQADVFSIQAEVAP